MNIVLLIGRFPPHDVGGAERQADRLAARLVERGHAVTVITRRWPGRAARETRDGFTIVRTPIALAGPARSAVDAVATLGAIRGLTPRPDVVLAFQTYISGAIAGLADALFGIPSVVWVRGENEYRFDRLPGRYAPSRFAWNQARRVLVQSAAHGERLLDQLERRDPLLADRLRPRLEVLGNGVDLPAEAVAGGEDWLYVGRLIGHKGLPVLLDALERVRGTAAERPLWVVGDGPERAALEREARDRGVDARFVGMVERGELAAYWARAAAIVLPSTQGEGLPNAVLEAMAAGVPAIATALPGIDELVGDAGRVVPQGDPEALAAALFELCDPGLRRELGRAARARAQARSFDRVSADLEAVLAAAARPAPRVWLVSPDPDSAGGVAAVARQMVASPLSRHYRLSVLPTYRAGSVAGRLWHGASGLARIALGLVFRKPDLVHLKVASRGSFARKVVVGGLCRLRGVPVLVHVHGGGFDRFVAGSPAPVRELARGLLERAPLVLAVSERWAGRLRLLCPRARIEALPNPIEVARFADLACERFAAPTDCVAADTPPLALFLGDLLERKGVYDLVAAWAEVVRAAPDARLVVCGRGEHERVRAAAREAGIAATIELPGFVGPEEKRRLLRAARVFVLPSYVEGVPISLLEAMAAGLPSVVTPVGGVLDVVTDGREALVVPPGDRAALASAIVRLLGSRELALTLAKAARQRVEEFDVAAFIERLDRIYGSILGDSIGTLSSAVAPASPGPPATPPRGMASGPEAAR